MKIHHKDYHVLENYCKSLQMGVNVLYSQLSPVVFITLKCHEIIQETLLTIERITKFIEDNEIVIGIDNSTGKEIIDK